MTWHACLEPPRPEQLEGVLAELADRIGGAEGARPRRVEQTGGQLLLQAVARGRQAGREGRPHAGFVVVRQEPAAVVVRGLAALLIIGGGCQDCLGLGARPSVRQSRV